MPGSCRIICQSAHSSEWFAAQVPLAAINIHLDTSCTGLQASERHSPVKPCLSPTPVALQPVSASPTKTVAATQNEIMQHISRPTSQLSAERPAAGQSLQALAHAAADASGPFPSDCASPLGQSPKASRAVTASSPFAESPSSELKRAELGTMPASSVYALQPGLVMHLSLPSGMPAPALSNSTSAHPGQSGQTARDSADAAASGGPLHSRRDVKAADLSDGFSSPRDTLNVAEPQHADLRNQHNQSGDNQHPVSMCGAGTHQAVDGIWEPSSYYLQPDSAASTAQAVPVLSSAGSNPKLQGSNCEPCSLPAAAMHHHVPSSFACPNSSKITPGREGTSITPSWQHDVRRDDAHQGRASGAGGACSGSLVTDEKSLSLLLISWLQWRRESRRPTMGASPRLSLLQFSKKSLDQPMTDMQTKAGIQFTAFHSQMHMAWWSRPSLRAKALVKLFNKSWCLRLACIFHMCQAAIEGPEHETFQKLYRVSFVMLPLTILTFMHTLDQKEA